MDIQRVILLGALGLISYMLVLQWNADYNTPVAAQQTQTESVSAYQPVAGDDLPSAAPAAQADLPTAGAAVSTLAAATGDLVSVTTDKFGILIDPRGGDIIEVKLLDHKATLEGEDPLVLLEQNANRTYVAQSGLVGPNGPDASKEGRPLYSVAEARYDMGSADTLAVDLNLVDNGVAITKRFTFTRGSNAIAMDYLIANNSDSNWQATLFGQLKRDRSADPSETTDMGMQSYLGPVFSTQENNYNKVSFDDIDDDGRYNEKSQDGWVAMIQHYFLSAWIPSPGQEYTYQARQLNGNYIAGFLAPSTVVAPGQTGQISATLYAGPKDTDQLEKLSPNLDLTIDFGILFFIASPIYMVLKWLYSIVGNYGLAIICVTILVKAALFHLNAKAFKSMAKMRKFGPEMARLKELYGDDRQKMSQEMMKLYSKEKINPLGGCLPIVAQMPIFIALYWVLMEAVEIRHAPFIGYIQDLSQMDPYFIMPILMGVTMFIQQMLNPTPPDPMQAKIMKMLPIVFTFFFLWFPAGLVLYWLVNNILSIAQQYVINKQIEAGDSK